MKFADKLLMMLLPHLNCILFKVARHLNHRYGVCEICDTCLCKIEKGESYETES